VRKGIREGREEAKRKRGKREKREGKVRKRREGRRENLAPKILDWSCVLVCAGCDWLYFGAYYVLMRLYMQPDGT